MVCQHIRHSRQASHWLSSFILSLPRSCQHSEVVHLGLLTWLAHLFCGRVNCVHYPVKWHASAVLGHSGLWTKLLCCNMHVLEKGNQVEQVVRASPHHTHTGSFSYVSQGERAGAGQRAGATITLIATLSCWMLITLLPVIPILPFYACYSFLKLP